MVQRNRAASIRNRGDALGPVHPDLGGYTVSEGEAYTRQCRSILPSKTRSGREGTFVWLFPWVGTAQVQKRHSAGGPMGPGKYAATNGLCLTEHGRAAWGRDCRS